LHVTATPGNPDVTIYLKLFDVDDPSSSASPLDTNDGGGPLGNDNKGSNSELNSTSITTDSNGIASAILTVSMQPGDNFRVAASTNVAALGQITQAHADNGQTVANVVLSEMLTVWRRLWIERDSMAPVPTSPSSGEKNYVSGTADSYTYNAGAGTTDVDLGQNLPNAFDDINQFAEGRYVVGNRTYPVDSSTAYSAYDDHVVVQGDPAGDGAGMEYTLYDDDDQTLLNVPFYCAMQNAYINEFRRAYIEPTYLSSVDYSDVVPFNLNLTSSEQRLGVDYDNEQDVWSESGFWACLVVACYQGDYDEDRDGTDEDEAVTWGCTPNEDDNSVMMFLEVNRDLPNPGVAFGNLNFLGSVSHSMAHEIGHTGGADHSDGGLMSEGASDGTTFTDITLEKFRSNSTWRTTN